MNETQEFFKIQWIVQHCIFLCVGHKFLKNRSCNCAWCFKVGGFHLDSGSLRFAVFQFVARMRKARERKQGKPDRKFSFSTIKIQGSEMKCYHRMRTDSCWCDFLMEEIFLSLTTRSSQESWNLSTGFLFNHPSVPTLKTFHSLQFAISIHTCS